LKCHQRAVGSILGYSLMQSGLAREIVLIDIDKERAQGETTDLNHGLFFALPISIWAADQDEVPGRRERHPVVPANMECQRIGNQLSGAMSAQGGLTRVEEGNARPFSGSVRRKRAGMHQ